MYAWTEPSVSHALHQDLARPIFPSLIYPTEAIRRGESGTVVLRWRIDQHKRISNIEVHQSSGSDILDEAAIKHIKRYGLLILNSPYRSTSLPNSFEQTFTFKFAD